MEAEEIENYLKEIFVGKADGTDPSKIPIRIGFQYLPSDVAYPPRNGVEEIKLSLNNLMEMRFTHATTIWADTITTTSN